MKRCFNPLIPGLGVCDFLKSIGCRIDSHVPTTAAIDAWAQAIADAGITHAAIWLPKPFQSPHTEAMHL